MVKNHLRDEQGHKFGFTVSEGSLGDASEYQTHYERQLGLTMTLYFRVVKASIFFFLFLGIISIPALVLFSKGQLSEEAGTTFQSNLSLFTIGNLGQAQAVCKRANVKVFDGTSIRCPGGTKMQRLV